LANDQNRIFGEDLIWRMIIFFKFGEDLIWRIENIAKFNGDLFWRIIQRDNFFNVCNVLKEITQDLTFYSISLLFFIVNSDVKSVSTEINIVIVFLTYVKLIVIIFIVVAKRVYKTFFHFHWYVDYVRDFTCVVSFPGSGKIS